MPEPKPEFDLDQMAREIADEPSSEEGLEAEVVADAAAAEVEPTASEAEPTEEVVEAEEDEEKFAKSFNGKPIPQKVFLERLKRESDKRNKVSAELQVTKAELEAVRRAAPINSEDVEKFKRLEGVFGNLDKAAREMPWLTPMLLAVGAGKKPDWEKVKTDMEAYLASVPKGDPILYQKIQELQHQQEEIVQERFNNQALEHIRGEDVEIEKIIGSKNDPASKPWWDLLNETALHQFNAMSPKSLKEGPNRIQMAKRMLALATTFHQKQLKAQVPPPNRARAALGAGRSAPAVEPKGAKKPPVDINSPEFEAFVLGA